MACRWCGSKQAAYDEGDVHECIRCFALYKAIKEKPAAARKILDYLQALAKEETR